MATVDYFLKIDGIPGESQDKTHKNEIQLNSFSWGATNAGTSATGGGAGAGKVHFSDFSITKSVDKASPKLMLACANGEHIKSAVLTCRKAGKEQQEYLKYTFTDLLISKFWIGGTEVMPADEVSLNFSKVEMEYKAQKADGTLDGAIKASYDVKQQTGG
ncbi:MAG: type VI secretion system tube protein Hcp [Bryobacteraceae bacterium]